MITVPTNNGVSLFEGTLQELTAKIEEDATDGRNDLNQRQRDYVIFEYVAMSYVIEVYYDGWDNYLDSLENVTEARREGKDVDNPENRSEITPDNKAELIEGVDNLREEAEQIIPGICRIAAAVAEASVMLERELSQQVSSLIKGARSTTPADLAAKAFDGEDLTPEMIEQLLSDPEGEA